MTGFFFHYTLWDVGILTAVFLILSAAVVILFHRMTVLQRRLVALKREQEVAMGFVHDVGDVFADVDEVDMAGLLERVLFYALRTTRAAAGAAYLLDKEREWLIPMATTGVFPPLVGGLDAGYAKAFSKTRHVEQLARQQAARMGQGLVGEAALLNRAILIPVAETDPRVPRFEDEFLTIHTLLLVPMRFRREVMGVLVVVNRVDGEGFTEGDRNVLQALADQASVSLHYAQLHAALHEKDAMDRDLLAAKRIQWALLPKAMPHMPGLDLAGFSEAAKQVGGDYYDVLELDADHIGIAIADVSGKSISGAILMAVCRSLLRLIARDCRSPRETLIRLNRMISADLPEDMFVTFLYLVVNRRTRMMSVVRAGHPPPLMYQAATGHLTAVSPGGIGIGLMDPDSFAEALQEQSVTLAPGDVVLAYTDGVTEAMDKSGSEWGEVSLSMAVQASLLDTPDAPAALILEAVKKRLMQFVGETPLYDDMTLLVLRVTADTEESERNDETNVRGAEYVI